MKNPNPDPEKHKDMNNPALEPPLPTNARPWSIESANAWRERVGWLVGANFLPSNAVNQLEMWQDDTWSPAVIDRELGWAAALGMNSMRVFLHDLMWEGDGSAYLRRIDEFLSIAAQHEIGVLVVFFDSCWHPFPRRGTQRPPEPHVHNSGWLQSPGITVLRDPARFDALEGYVKGVIERFKDDPRIHGWDIWNEPDNANVGSRGSRDFGERKAEVVEPLLLRVFEWAHAVRPSQPITSGIWKGEFEPGTLSSLQRLQLALSDVVSFHWYQDAESTLTKVRQLGEYGRPILCTEYMCRQVPWATPPGSTFQAILPALQAHGVGAYNWGLVAGKSQTQYPWDSWQQQYDAAPLPWFHDVLRPDGSAYDEAEVAFLKEFVRTRTQSAKPTL